MPNAESCPIKWKFDGDGQWTAASRVIDPIMSDEPQDTLCKEWCFQWRVNVDEYGRFVLGESDTELLRHTSLHRRAHNSLDTLMAAVDLVEDEIRGLEKLSDGEPVVLLPKEVYAR